MSNHVAALDDPLVTAALLPPGALLQPRQLRWTLCATDRCFTSATAGAFFRAAKARAQYTLRCSAPLCLHAQHAQSLDFAAATQQSKANLGYSPSRSPL